MVENIYVLVFAIIEEKLREVEIRCFEKYEIRYQSHHIILRMQQNPCKYMPFSTLHTCNKQLEENIKVLLSLIFRHTNCLFNESVSFNSC